MGIHPGASIGQNVRLIRPLSRGGMGSVWRAEHLTLHTEVAVKFVSDALIGDQGFLARFTREAVSSARIKSPHAVQIFDHGVTADGVPYIVMELLDGEDLRTRILREKKLHLSETVKVVTQVARGLSRAHAAGVVHRDIKPGNIFLMEQDGELFVKILDFGIAKHVGDVDQQVTMTGQIIGTPHYVSPEQIERPREADPQNDLWSLAVVAYKCLTGELPFEGESVGAVAIAIDKAAYTRVTTREAGLPTMLDVWFARAFARKPTERFVSAKEMALCFEAAAKDEPLPAVSDSAVFSLRNTGERAVSAVAKLAPAAHDFTPGATPSSSEAADEHPTAADKPAEQDERATRPDGAAAVTNGASASGGSPNGASNKALDTPLTMGEPTLAHGTVTQIELQPRRTKLYGAVIAGVAVLGAITVGVLSQPEKNGANATSPIETAATSVSTPSETVSTLAPAVTASASAGASATAPASEPPGTATGTKSAAPAVTTTTTTKKKKKDRGF
ncbi:MAG: serine/threonine protein kinase [Polyangiaceae bacterium]|nr:serine/threonine protein kinase [Polyangiaceae bacterium]